MQKINLLLISALVFVAATNDSIILSQALAEESTYGPTKSGDLIWNIAGKVIPNSSVNRPQMVLGLLKANPQAFKVPCNFNSLRVGAKLRIPPLSDIQAVSQADAKKEYNRQNEEWKNRSKQPIVCPTATTPSPPAVTEAEVTPKVASTEATPKVTSEKPVEASPTPPIVSPPAATQEKTSTPSVPAVAPSPNQMAPKTEVKLVPEEKSQGEGKPPESKPVTTITTSSPSGSGPTPTETTSQPSSTLMLGILTIGGLLAASLLGWLLHKHGKQSPKLEGSASEEDSKFSSSEEPQMILDNMPLHTPKTKKEDEQFKI